MECGLFSINYFRKKKKNEDLAHTRVRGGGARRGPAGTQPPPHLLGARRAAAPAGAALSLSRARRRVIRLIREARASLPRGPRGSHKYEFKHGTDHVTEGEPHTSH